MEDKIHLKVMTAGGTVFDRMVRSIRIPTEEGSIGVLSGHAPMLCAVSRGVLLCRFGENGETEIDLGDGAARIAGNEAQVLVSSAKLKK